MSEMVERAKKAVEECGIDWQDWDGNYGIADKFGLIVRAVLAAIREPTGEMIDAGADSFEFPDGPFGRPSLIGQPSKTWRAMIDAALAGKKP